MRIVVFQFAIIFCVWSVWFFNTGLNKIVELVSSHGIIMLTMLFGSFVAGSTSLGGGAVAFPVFTKVLSIPADVTLVFSLAIQSVGMTAAMLMLFICKAPISKRIIIGSIIPGALGISISLFGLNQFIIGGQAKIIFSLFSLFVALILLFDRNVNHRKFRSSDGIENQQQLAWWLIFIGSFIGGLLSGLIGTGIDFVLFSLMILFSQIGLKKAVATSVCVMAINAVIGFIMVYQFSNNFTGIVVEYWLSAVPIVVVGAPLGALACRYFHRDVIFYLLMVLICLDVATTVWILGNKVHLIALGFVITVVAFLLIFQKNLAARKSI